MPTAIEVAKYLLSLVDEESGDSVSNLKLQKLLYYAQGFNLAAYNEPLFPEQIEPWAHGPVVPEVFHRLKEFGAERARPPIDVDFEVALTARDRELLDEVYAVYGHSQRPPSAT